VTVAPVLDTHAWVWWLDQDARLGRATRRALDELQPDGRPYVSAISLWEVAMLVERKRLSFDMPLLDWLETATHPRAVRIVGIDPAVAAEVAALPATFHRDPADRIIVSTCRTLGAPIVTHDRRIRRARLVTLWKPSRASSP
jgi:PIN domain nuclease of toxin-antitoxin system